MVKINYLSDLHLEFYDNMDFEKILNFDENGEILCLCGDIGYPEKKIYEDFLRYCSKKFLHVFLISGNHEYYSNNKLKTIQNTNICIENLSNKFNNIYFLNNKVKYLHEFDLYFIGTTLWTELPEDFLNHNTKKYYNDFKKIYYEWDNSKFILNEDYLNLLNSESIEFLNNSLITYKECKKIILTHHLPTYKIISKKYANLKYNYFFANNLDEIINKSNIKLWLCGHSHSPNEIKLNNCIIALNPIGYPGELSNPNYNQYIIL